MIQFAWPWFAVILPLPWLIRKFSKAKNCEAVAPIVVPFFDQIQELQNNSKLNNRTLNLPLFLSTIIWILLIMACMRPQWLADPIEIPLTGRDLMLAIDVSGSMETPDFSENKQVTRLEVVKQVASKFIKQRTGDRVGLIVFGTQAFLQSPFTFDLTAINKLLQQAEIGLAGEKTAIGDAIGMAIKHFKDKPAEQKVLILLTDGSNNAGVSDPIRAAELAKTQNLKIYTIGIGAYQMNIPGIFGSRTINPSQDLDESTLKQIAQITGGQYFRAASHENLKNIIQDINNLNPVRNDKHLYRPVDDLYYVPLLIAFIITLISSIGYLVQNYLRARHV